MKRALAICFILFSTCLYSQVYRSVDEDGNVVFSDEPTSGAVEVEVKELETVRPLEVAPRNEQKKPAKAQPGYSSIVISSPANDTSVRENSGNVVVDITLTPQLMKGHSVVLYLDGQQYAKGQAASFKLENVNRGTHQLRAAVVDAQNRQLLDSQTSTFHILRTSVQH